MDLGVRQIRSSGQGSGSVEVTLPTELRDLVGLPCRVTLRDGMRPDIVLQPDLRRARLAFARLWQQLRAALLADRGSAAEADMPIASFTFALRHAAGRPNEGAAPLAWLDGQALADPPPHPMPATARSLAALAQALAAPLGIATGLAGDFGAATGFALTGSIPDPCHEEACALAGDALADIGIVPGAAFAQAGDDAAAAGFWLAATPALRHLAARFQGWTADPAAHGRLRAAWRRGVAIDLNGG